MADKALPHFHNTPGFQSIRIGVKQFKCIGASPPLDHPHIFLEMGENGEIVCPYCSTHFIYEATLKSGLSSPPGCVYGNETTDQ